MRRATVGVLAGLVVLLLAALLSRPYDEALFSSAGGGGDWSEHRLRVRLAYLGWERGDWAEALVGADRVFPPGLHAVFALLGKVLGWGVRSTHVGLIGLVLGLAGLAAAVAGRLGGRTAALAALAITASLPGVHGSAFVYHYDLAMVCWLWAGVALLVAGQDRFYGLAGLGAGLCFAAACWTKWSAPYFGVPLVAGAWLVTRPDGVRPAAHRAVSAVLATALAAALIDQWLRASHSSLQELLAMTYQVPVELAAGGLIDQAAAVVDVLGRARADERPPEPAWTALYVPQRLAASMLSPLLTPLVAAGLAVWLWLDRRGWPLLLAAPVLLWLIVVWGTGRPDDRLLLPLLPVYAIAIALGWSKLGPRAQLLSALVWSVASLWVAWDFHHVDRPHPHRMWLNEQFRAPDHWTLAGLGADSCFDKTSGWVRHDEEGLEPFLPHKDDAWAAAMACDPVALRVEDPGLQPVPDDVWWDYRNHLHALRTGSELLDVTTVDGQRYSGQTRTGRTVALVVADREQRPPIEELLPGYTLVTTIPAPDGPYATIAVYADGPCP